MPKDGAGGAAKRGRALLSGLLRCGRCGRKLYVAYSGTTGRVPRYMCHGGRVDRGASSCLTIGGLRVDQAVADAVLEAIQPAGVEATLAASDHANTWWNSYNPAYPRFDVDCTNYISQCLRAGGAPMWGYPNRERGWWIGGGNVEF